MKKLLSVVLMTLLTFSMFANSNKETGGEDKMVIGYATKSSTSPFWVILNKGAEDAAKELGVELIMLGPPKENDVVGQLAVLEDLINQEVDALMVAACDSVGVAPAIKTANEDGIPVIAIGDEILGAKVDSFLSTNNYNAAVAAADWMAGELGGKGNIVLLNGMIAQGSGKGRYEGFRDTVAAKYPDMNIVFSKDCAWEDEKALAAFEDAMAANDQIDGVFVGWDGAALAAHTALTEAGRIDETIICGFDCYPQSLKFMKEGTFEGNIAQSPYKMGYDGIVSAYKSAMGEVLAPIVDTGVVLVTPENVDQYIADNGVKLPN